MSYSAPLGCNLHFKVLYSQVQGKLNFTGVIVTDSLVINGNFSNGWIAI